MIVPWVLLLFAVHRIESTEYVYQKLVLIQEAINTNVKPFCFGTGHSTSKQSLLSNRYIKYAGDMQVLVYPFCLVAKELGNRLGNLFNEIACAEASGIHFITVHKSWDLTGSHTGNHSTFVSNTSLISDPRKLAFLNALPSIIVHKAPVAREAAVQNIQRYCKCTRYCWGNANAPWVNRTESIGNYLRIATQAYLDARIDTTLGTEVIESDMTNAKSTSLPLIPDVALQYRCGDNIGFSYMYGILPFTAFDSRIPTQSQYIYVLSDHPLRAAHSPYSSRCQLILKNLFEYLQHKFPSSTILIKRGGDMFLDYARLIFAKTTICSASSFCFWPAISNPHLAYFPVSSVIAGADSIELAPDFGTKFHWIDEPKIISNFKNIRPWTKIIDVLKGDMKLS